MPKVSSKTDEAAVCFQGLMCLSSLQDDQRSAPTVFSSKKHLNMWHIACPAVFMCDQDPDKQKAVTMTAYTALFLFCFGLTRHALL